MPKCQRCNIERILTISGKCNDLCYVKYDEEISDGCVPREINLGGGDYIELNICMECGQVQGHYPIDDYKIIDSIERV
jgi:hypothetical protein